MGRDTIFRERKAVLKHFRKVIENATSPELDKILQTLDMLAKNRSPSISNTKARNTKSIEAEVEKDEEEILITQVHQHLDDIFIKAKACKERMAEYGEVFSDLPPAAAKVATTDSIKRRMSLQAGSVQSAAAGKQTFAGDSLRRRMMLESSSMPAYHVPPRRHSLRRSSLAQEEQPGTLRRQSLRRPAEGAPRRLSLQRPSLTPFHYGLPIYQFEQEKAKEQEDEEFNRNFDIQLPHLRAANQSYIKMAEASLKDLTAQRRKSLKTDSKLFTDNLGKSGTSLRHSTNYENLQNEMVSIDLGVYH